MYCENIVPQNEIIVINQIDILTLKQLHLYIIPITYSHLHTHMLTLKYSHI
jgi:hypothetical protein